jgi:hypothetical protein
MAELTGGGFPGAATEATVLGEATGGLGEFFESAADVIKAGVTAIDSPLFRADVADFINAAHRWWVQDEEARLLQKPIRVALSPMDILGAYVVYLFIRSVENPEFFQAKLLAAMQVLPTLMMAFKPNFPMPKMPELPGLNIDYGDTSIGFPGGGAGPVDTAAAEALAKGDVAGAVKATAESPFGYGFGPTPQGVVKELQRQGILPEV